MCPPECLQVRRRAANNDKATKKSDPYEELIPWAKTAVPTNSKTKIFQWAFEGLMTSFKASPNCYLFLSSATGYPL